MFKHHLKISFRNLLKNKGYTAINSIGLTLGIWCCLMISLFIKDEIGWDNFHEGGGQLSLVMANVAAQNGDIDTWDGIGYPVGEALLEHIPEIKALTRTAGPRSSAFGATENFMDVRVMGADPNFFTLFSFPLNNGASQSCLENPKSVVISQELASSYFGKANPVGKPISITLDENAQEYLVTGVFQKIPQKSTLQFDAVVPLDNFLPMNNTSWGNGWTKTYALYDDNLTLGQINEKIKETPKNWGNSDWFTLFLQPLQDRYLYGKFENGKVAGGRIDNIYLFLIIAIVTLVIACFNFINLATARAVRRTKEVGIKKVIGAGIASLMFQFFMESWILVTIASILALILAQLSIPVFNSITSKTISHVLNEPFVYIALLCIILITVLLSGIYPAYFLSHFKAVAALKGVLKEDLGQKKIRAGLVAFQFCVSIVMVAGTMIVYFQMQYIHNKNLGLNRENIIYAPMDMGTYKHAGAIMEELQQFSDFKAISRASGDFVHMEGGSSDPIWEGQTQKDEKLWFTILNVDFGLLEMLDIQLDQGRFFSPEMATDTLNYIVNEEAVKAMGMENPIGKKLSFWGDEGGQIVGVVKDFHFTSLHTAIKPLIIRCRPKESYLFYAKTNVGKTSQAIAHLETVHKKFSDLPFSYHFLDNTLEERYQNEMKIQNLSSIFALIAIAISCLGLFGLVVFTINQHTKEIAIRKVLGANIPTLLGFLSIDFLKIVSLSFLIAAPISWYFAHKWIQGFAFHITFGWWIFAFAGLMVLCVAMATVCLLTLRAAMANPVKSLRTE